MIGLSVAALLLPLPLVHLLVSGHALVGITALFLWLVSVWFAVLSIRRRRYGLAYLPMLPIAGLFFIVQKLWQ